MIDYYPAMSKGGLDLPNESSLSDFAKRRWNKEGHDIPLTMTFLGFKRDKVPNSWLISRAIIKCGWSWYTRKIIRVRNYAFRAGTNRYGCASKTAVGMVRDFLPEKPTRKRAASTVPIFAADPSQKSRNGSDWEKAIDRHQRRTSGQNTLEGIVVVTKQ